jgi:hypothetical protein
LALQSWCEIVIVLGGSLGEFNLAMTSETQQTVRATKGPVDWKLSISTGGAYACILVGLVVAILPFVVLHYDKGYKFTLSDFSSLGSYWQGSVASLFSLGAFLLIYATFLAQQKQIAQQDSELEDQKQQFQLQHESIKRQNFEASFFQLLHLQRELQAQIETVALVPNNNGLGAIPTTVHGKDCFQVFCKTLKDHYTGFKAGGLFISAQLATEPQPLPPDTQLANEAYKKLYETHQQQLAHYFRNLYHVFKFVAKSDMPDKRRYTSLVRAQLSAYELALLFYNCVSFYGDDFKAYVEKFGLMEHIDAKLLLDPAHRRDTTFYAECAYE